MPVVKDAGDSALLLELEPVVDAHVNARAIAIAGAMREAAVTGVRDVVSTFRSVAVYFDPLRTDVDAVRSALERASAAPAGIVERRSFEIPVVYGGEGGPDLADVAQAASLTPGEVIAKHSAPEYRVFMLGFLPGFAYLGTVAPEIAVARRPSPRLRVAAGSVGIAGLQTAVYPSDSPGGWQIVGRTTQPMFDPQRVPAALLAPGDRVRFVPVQETEGVRPKPDTTNTISPDVVSGLSRTAITVLRPGLFTTVQDEGRWGHQGSGVAVSGALDTFSLRQANALLGNDRGAAAIEVTLAGSEMRFDADVTVAITGADLGATLDGVRIALNSAAQCVSGSVLRFTERRSGTRTYVGVAGGIDVPPVLGSRATHVTSAMGGVRGRPLAAGDILGVTPTRRPRSSRQTDLSQGAPRGGAALRVLPGPQDDWFEDDAFRALEDGRFRIAPQSNRMGYRLEGARIPRKPDREMISDATFHGAIQVPPSGEPILLMADRQTTGGYPQIATVISADLPVAAQLAPGDWIEFRMCSRADALAALIAQEGRLLALG